VQSDGTLESWRIALTPRNAETTRLLRQIVLNGNATDITRVDLLQANGDEQIMTIRAVPSNQSAWLPPHDNR
jgi:hypothetical protein